MRLGEISFLRTLVAGGHALAYVYFEEEPGRRAAAHLRRGPADGGEFAKLPELVGRVRAVVGGDSPAAVENL